MGFKRKRSVDESPVSISSFGRFATPDAQFPTPTPNGTMEVDTPTSRGSGWDFSNLGRTKGCDWGMRQRKRFRDNRPAEHIIHENTLNKLFAAQRKQPHAEPIPSDSLLPPQEPAVGKPQKSTLHAFWNIAAPPVRPPAVQMPQRHCDANVPRCEDCDALLGKDDSDMDVDMEMDGQLGRSPFSCSDCGRNVCGECAVVANTRHCLKCGLRGI